MAGGRPKNLEVFSPTIGRQLLDLGLIDEIDLHIAPILLGEGIRLYDNPGSEPIRLHRVGEGDPTSAVNVRYRPTTTAKIPLARPEPSAPCARSAPRFGMWAWSANAPGRDLPCSACVFHPAHGSTSPRPSAW